MLETKNLSDRLIQLINTEGILLSETMEKQIRSTVHMAFREGYGDCLHDLNEGLIKKAEDI